MRLLIYAAMLCDRVDVLINLLDGKEALLFRIASLKFPTLVTAPKTELENLEKG